MAQAWRNYPSCRSTFAKMRWQTRCLQTMQRGEKRSETEDKDKPFPVGFYGRFERRIPVGSEIVEDKIDARFRIGVLSLVLPKTAKAQPQVKRIAIKICLWFRRRRVLCALQRRSSPIFTDHGGRTMNIAARTTSMADGPFDRAAPGANDNRRTMLSMGRSLFPSDAVARTYRPSRSGLPVLRRAINGSSCSRCAARLLSNRSWATPAAGHTEAGRA